MGMGNEYQNWWCSNDLNLGMCIKKNDHNSYGFQEKKKKHIDLWIIHTQLTNPDTLPSSLIDSNVSLKWKQQKSKESGARSLAHNT
jgi:hypothetical protein